MLGGHNSTEEEDLEKERERLLRRNTIEADLANAERADTINHYNSYDDGVDLSHRPDLWRPLEPGLTEQERRAVARKRVQRIFQLPLTFKKPHHEDINMPNINITPTPSSSGAEEIKRFQINRPANHFLIADYNKTKIQVKCQKDFEGAERPDWSVVRWIHVDKIEESNLPILKSNLPAPILIKDITRPSYKFRVEEHERYVLIILHLIANPEDAASNSRRRSVVGDISKSSKSSKSSKFSSDGKRQRSSDEITTVKLIVYLFFEANTLVTVTETPNTLLANCILTRLSREPSRIRNSDCSYLLYYIIKFTLAPLQLIINYHSEYLEMMEDKITYQRMEVASYQNIFHEIHEIRRELQHLRTRLVNISEAIDDVREIADREIESRAPIVAAASAFESQLYKSDAQKGKFVAPSPNVERTGIFPHRLKLASIVRLQFKHLSSNVNQMAVQTTTLQEVCSWLADLVFQTLSQKMNQTMKTLTLISMIFIPLTFIVGVYGTNFDYLPELRWKYGYIFLWGLCAGVVIVELIMFRRLRWI